MGKARGGTTHSKVRCRNPHPGTLRRTLRLRLQHARPRQARLGRGRGNRGSHPWCDWGSGTHREMGNQRLSWPPDRHTRPCLLSAKASSFSGSRMAATKKRECCCSTAQSTLAMHVLPALANRSGRSRCLLQGPLHPSQPPLMSPLWIGCHFFTRDPRFTQSGTS